MEVRACGARLAWYDVLAWYDLTARLVAGEPFKKQAAITQLITSNAPWTTPATQPGSSADTDS
jgi:hypothetical protein